MAEYQYIDNTGVIVPDTEAVQSTVEGEYRAALGQDLIVEANTPQGALITAEVTARANILRNNAAVANQINPNLAGGVFLDAIWSLTGGGRYTATYSVCKAVTLGGLPGTFIQAGAQASLSDGTLFASVADVTLDASGAGTVDFQAVDAGAIAATVGALNQPVTAVLGWDTVTNPTAAVLGRDGEKDLPSRLRRKNTLSLQNVALPESAVSDLYNNPNVTSLQYRENYTKADATIDGIFLLANSVWACVDGGTDTEVATALLKNKSLGANWNGAVTVNLPHPKTGQTYPVKFDRPAAVAVAARVTLRNTGALTDPTTAVQDAILNYAAGLQEGEAGFVVGSSVSPFEIAGAVGREVPGVYVKLCEVSLASPISWGTGDITIAINQKATIARGSILVVLI